MRTSSIRAIRRVELSRAAFEAVIRYGLRKTTLEKYNWHRTMRFWNDIFINQR